MSPNSLSKKLKTSLGIARSSSDIASTSLLASSPNACIRMFTFYSSVPCWVCNMEVIGCFCSPNLTSEPNPLAALLLFLLFFFVCSPPFTVILLLVVPTLFYIRPFPPLLFKSKQVHLKQCSRGKPEYLHKGELEKDRFKKKKNEDGNIQKKHLVHIPNSKIQYKMIQ